MVLRKPSSPVLLLVALSGCGVWIGPDDVASVRDRDLDGVPLATDCDDRDPAAQEVRDWFEDRDGDGVGAGLPTRQCTPPVGASIEDGDCNDGDPDVYPGAPEYCDGRDNDCDELVDDDPTYFTWYPDEDGDGFGSEDRAFETCEPQTTGTGEGGDCDDNDPALNPGALEVCSGLDEDCDGLIDQDDPDMDGEATWYADGDDDGYGVGPGSTGCSPPGPGDWSQLDGDCDDADPDTSPGAPEVCDGVDNDCDGDADVLDEDLADGAPYYPDNDGDGFGDAFSPVVACEPPPGHSPEGSDCDDGDAEVFPRGSEVLLPDVSECSDQLDNDCDGSLDGNDDDCQDDDVDGVVNGVDAVRAWDGDGDQLAEQLCFRREALLEEPWQSAAAIPVYQKASALFPEDSLDPAEALAPDAGLVGYWCWDLTGLASGTYVAELVSEVADDGSSDVDATGCGNWKRADLDGYCGQTSDSFCGGGLLVDACTLAGRSVRFTWDGSAL